MIDWTPVTAGDYMKIEYLDLLKLYFFQIRDLFYSKLKRPVLIQSIDTSGRYYTVPFETYINIIERNIDALTAEGYTPLEWQPTKIWLGEHLDRPKLDFNDVNRWFSTLRQLEDMIKGMADRLLITGTFTAGDNRTRQFLRTV